MLLPSIATSCATSTTTETAEMVNRALFCSLVLLACIARTVEAVSIVQPLPDDIYAISGSAVKTTCIFVGNNNQPPLNVTFQRSDEDEIKWFDIQDSERVFQTNETQGDTTSATLHFTNITVQDDQEKGYYRCIGYSATGGKSDSLRFTVRVTARDDLPVARVIPNVTASYGDSVRLYCNLTHKNNEKTTPIDEVTYLRDNNPVKVTNDVTQALIFHSVRVRDGGNYVCRIRVKLHSHKPYDVISSPGYLHMRVRFPIKESKLVAVIGDSVILVCSAEGYPLDIEWKKNEPGSTAVIKPDSRSDSILVIHNATTEDSGNYSCNARDWPGQQYFLVTVNSNSTSTSAINIVSPGFVTTILPAFGLWTWWPSTWQ